MFKLAIIFCFISPARPFGYTIDATLQLGPRWEYKYDITSLGNDKNNYVKKNVSQNRAAILESDAFSTENESEEQKYAPKQDIARSLAWTLKPSMKQEKENKGIEATKNRNNHENNNIARRNYGTEYDIDDTEDISHEDFPEGFTRPIISDDEKKHFLHSHHKKKNESWLDFAKLKKTNKSKTLSLDEGKSQDKDNSKQSQSDITYDNSDNTSVDERYLVERFINPFANKSTLSKWKEEIQKEKENAKKIAESKIITKNQTFSNSTHQIYINITEIIRVIKLTSTSKKIVQERSKNSQNKTQIALSASIHTTDDTDSSKGNNAKVYNKQSIRIKNKNFNATKVQLHEKINRTNHRSQRTKKKLSNNKSKNLKMSHSYEKIKTDTKIDFKNLYKDLNSETQRIKDNATITSFTKHILERTLELFDAIANKTPEYRWRKKMKYLARSYEDKFNEFLRNTKRHTLRTRLGTRKLILNAIDVSNRIVNRLINYMENDMEKKGFVYNSLTPILLKAEISKAESHELKRACHKLGICKTQKGFTHFIIDFLLMMLSVNNTKFKTAFDSMVKAATKTEFGLSSSIEDGIKERLDYCARQDVHVQKGIIMLMKNMIANRNSPLVLYADSDPTERKVQSTLAFMEIINTLDEKVPSSKNNVQDWNKMKHEMEDWVNGKIENIDSTMANFIAYVSNAIKDIDVNSWQVVMRNSKILFE